MKWLRPTEGKVKVKVMQPLGNSQDENRSLHSTQCYSTMSHCCDHSHLPFRAALGRGWSYQLMDEMEGKAGPDPVSVGSDFLEVWAPKFPSSTPASWASVTIPFVLPPPFTQFLFPFCPRAPGTNTGPLWPWSPCSGFCFPCICLVRLGLNPHKTASVNEVCLRNPPTGEQRRGSPASQDGSSSIAQGIPGRGSSRTLLPPIPMRD